MHKDHQGSVIATTNASGTVVSQAIYDPWGKRTAVYLTSVLANFTYSEPTDRGYTGHKHIKGLDIIHMGGRIYDPTLGRFLQADPNIQAPLDSQSYNRYAYVRNNPMSMTDPSGYFFDSLTKLAGFLGGGIAGAALSQHTHRFIANSHINCRDSRYSGDGILWALQYRLYCSSDFEFDLYYISAKEKLQNELSWPNLGNAKKRLLYR